MQFHPLHLLLLGLAGLAACQQQAPVEKTVKAEKVSLPAAKQDNYWYQGKAEVSSYTVTQERYGEMREAGQVMVFVTEDFSANKQVKLDAGPAPGDELIPILKLNTVRRFKTGIYDYSVMQSVFTPVEATRKGTLKTTTTIQDWCGHVFVQTNAREGIHHIAAFSYFESEGDAKTTVQAGLLEDEIWTLVRLDPEGLDGWDTTVLPGMVYARFRHKPLLPEQAAISIEKGAEESTLHLTYKNISRSLSIRYETAYPHRILGWEEKAGGKLMSKGALKHTMMDAYWKHNDNASAPLREALNPGF